MIRTSGSGCATLAGLGLLLLAGPAQALSRCEPGQRVLAPGGSLATVVETRGSGCRLQRDGVSYTETFAAFMLKPAAGSAASSSAAEAGTAAALPRSGQYQCSGGMAGKLKLSFSDGGRYANEQGKSGSYSLRPDGKLAFTSGPWAGFYAKVLDHGRIGLTSSAGSTSYYMTCDRR